MHLLALQMLVAQHILYRINIIYSSSDTMQSVLPSHSRCLHTLHVWSRPAAIFKSKTITTKMQEKRKTTSLEHPVPNFTGFEYSDVIGEFSEHDRLSESDISQLVCADEFRLERTVNSFNDRELNDHLYQLFYGKKTENITLMR